MRKEWIGALVVSEDGTRIAGIISDRGIMNVIADQGVDVITERVHSVMTLMLRASASGRAAHRLRPPETQRLAAARPSRQRSSDRNNHSLLYGLSRREPTGIDTPRWKGPNGSTSISRGLLVQLLVGERFILQADVKCGLTPPHKITETF